MDRTIIESAATHYSSEVNRLELLNEIETRRAFMEGAIWRVDSVWHKAIEESPKPCSLVLVEMLDGSISLYQVFDGKTDMLRWRRWAYVSDLVP